MPTLIRKDVNPDAQDAKRDDWVTPELRAELRQVFAEDIAELEALLDRDLSHWR